MSGKTHLQGGYLFGNIIAYLLMNTLFMQLFAFFNIDSFNLMFYGLLVIGAAIGGLAPDLDHPNSKISHMVPILALIVSISNGIMTLLIKCIIKIAKSKFVKKIKKSLGMSTKVDTKPLENIQKLFRHRGLFHTCLILVINIAIYFALYNTFDNAYLNIFLFGYNVGFMSHIFFDMLTIEGVPFFLPFSAKRIRFAAVRSGSSLDHLLGVILFVINVLLSVLFITTLLKSVI